MEVPEDGVYTFATKFGRRQRAVHRQREGGRQRRLTRCHQCFGPHRAEERSAPLQADVLRGLRRRTPQLGMDDSFGQADGSCSGKHSLCEINTVCGSAAG